MRLSHSINHIYQDGGGGFVRTCQFAIECVDAQCKCMRRVNSHSSDLQCDLSCLMMDRHVGLHP